MTDLKPCEWTKFEEAWGSCGVNCDIFSWHVLLFVYVLVKLPSFYCTLFPISDFDFIHSDMVGTDTSLPPPMFNGSPWSSPSWHRSAFIKHQQVHKCVDYWLCTWSNKGSASIPSSRSWSSSCWRNSAAGSSPIRSAILNVELQSKK